MYCEAVDCVRHEHVGAVTMRLGHLPTGWLQVREYGGLTTAYCGWQCLLRKAASLEPEEIV